jgi:serine/threonine protein phosphatase PrpC
VIMAVADGVGSVEGSAAASAAAVDAVCAALLDSALASLLGATLAGALPGAPPEDDHWTRAFAAAHAAVVAAGGATTLVVAVVGGDGRGAVARVGDSTALLLVGGGWRELWPTGAPDDGSLSTATAALPARPGLAPEIEVVAVNLEAGAALILVTDGIADPLRDGPTTVAPALAEALAAVPSPLALALVADFSRQGCFDDRTVVGLWAQEDGGA